MTDVDACTGCKLNPRNRPAPSPRLSWLYRIQAMQAAGAQFQFTDLRPGDWNDLIILKSEQQLFEKEKLDKLRAGR